MAGKEPEDETLGSRQFAPAAAHTLRSTWSRISPRAKHDGRTQHEKGTDPACPIIKIKITREFLILLSVLSLIQKELKNDFK